MRILIKENKGSITVEMCFLMPIVIGIIMMLVFIILKGVNEGAALGASQVKVYEYSDLFGDDDSSHEWKNLQVEALFDDIKGEFKVGNNVVSAAVTSCGADEKYSISNVGCKREWDVCTDRLRRWQLYGDVLRE